MRDRLSNESTTQQRTAHGRYLVPGDDRSKSCYVWRQLLRLEKQGVEIHPRLGVEAGLEQKVTVTDGQIHIGLNMKPPSSID